MRARLDMRADAHPGSHHRVWIARSTRARARVGLTRATTLLAATTLAACGPAPGARASARPRARGWRQGKSPSTSRPSSLPTAAAAPTPAPPASVKRCGPAAAETLARTEGLMARRIYANELSSPEVGQDRNQVETYSPLLSALARGSRAAVTEAVTSLVYSHTHVVRLRVTRGGQVIRDVGGADILAPVSGNLRLGGRTVGRYVLSVQDDLGYVKLVTRFLGVPLVLRAGSRSLPGAGATAPGPATIP